MERLEAKKVNGKIYYYYSKWAWVNGKCRRVWQKYLGNLKTIVDAIDGKPEPICAEVFQWGLPMALWNECIQANIKNEIDALCPKRNQGLTVGDYITVVAINRAIKPSSKRSMWEWFSQTALLRQFPGVSKAQFTSQRFWDHMNKMTAETAIVIWKRILKNVIHREVIDLSSISYDGTNFYTFIDTFNTRCEIAQRGKNKQGRNNLRQVSYALFCSQDGHVPLYYRAYKGNRNDARQFPQILEEFHSFLEELSEEKCSTPRTTIIFDKGNNSADNFALVDSLNLDYVGSVKLNEVKDLVEIDNNDPIFKSCNLPELNGTKAFQVRKTIYGKERVMVVTYNQNLFDSQWLTLQRDISNACEKLSILKKKLDDRINGVQKQGKCPTIESITKQCDSYLKRQHLKQIISKTISKDANNIPALTFQIDTKALYKLENTYLGKNIVVTSLEKKTNDDVIKTYRSQFVIEDVFKEMKDRNTGSWWPLYHWTDSKIQVHAFYCSIALLIRSLMHHWVTKVGVQISMKRMLKELDDIREVINVYPPNRRRKKQTKQTVLTKTSELQDQLITLLKLDKNQV
ncbi:IS1634 family transposase [bacterium]|nr:IS1634 family transposase [bacterium]